MLFGCIKNFVRKPLEQKQLTLRYFLRRGLSKLPYAPCPVRLSFSSREEVAFWWSYVALSPHPERSLFDYSGDDVGELCFLWKILRPGMVFFDVGAYHGLYSLVAARRLDGRGQVVAFEPSARERRRFRFHLRMNGMSRVQVEPYALNSREGKMGLFTVLSGFTSMNSLSRPPILDPVEEIQVDAIRLDEYVQKKGISQIDVIKVDTEGAELEVFRGAPGTLKRFRPLLICEVLDWVTRPWGYAACEIVASLKRCDYEWFEFRADGTIFPHHQKDTYPDVKNYLAVPKEKRALVQDWIRP
jgi:FkbM family methyltransferase